MDEQVQSQLSIGSQAPQFCLPSSAGGDVCLSDYLGKSQVIIFFVREFA